MRHLLTILFSIGIFFGNQAQEKRLRPGDMAPKITDVKWLLGEAVVNQEIPYVLFLFENYLTGSSRKGLSVIQELKEKYGKKATFLAIYSPMDMGVEKGKVVEELTIYHEYDQSKMEEKFTDFAKGMDLDYAIGLDDQQRHLWKSWFGEGYQSIGLVFVVNRSGQVAYMSHPFDKGRINAALTAVMEGGMEGVRTWKEQYDKMFKQKGQIQQAWKDGNDNALLQLDKLIVEFPENEDELYAFKYSLLHHESSDEYKTQATNLLNQLVDTKPATWGYWWENIMAMAIHAVNGHGHNPEPVLTIVNYAVEHAESPMVAAGLELTYRASFLASLGQAEKAVDHIKTILKEKKLPSLSKKRLIADLYLYRFMALAGKDDARANQVLQEALENKPVFTKWGSLVDYALENQKSPDYDLLMKLADHSLQVKALERLPSSMAPLEKQIALRGDILAAKGAPDKAIEAYKKDLAKARALKDDVVITLCNKKLVNLQLDNL